MRFDREQLAWAAGFFDGEGHAGYWEQKGYGHIHLALSQSGDHRVLDRFIAALGFGAVSGPYKQGRTRRRPVYRLTYHSFETAQAAIAILWQWLSPVKRQQAKSILVKYREYQQEAS